MTFLTRISLKNRLIVGLITLAIAVMGIFSMTSLKQELMPSMQVPMAFVSVQSQGLAPEEMSRTVTEPVEQALSSVPAITKVTSTTSSGMTNVIAEWPFSENEDDTLQAIRAAADALKPSFPTGTEVEVFSGGASDLPAMVISAGSKQKDDAKFGDALAQTVVPALQGVNGVKQVTLAGREEQRIMINLRPADMTRLKVTPEQIAPILQAHGVAMPAGEAKSPEGPLSVTVGSALSSLEEIAALPVPVQDGAVRISDFADVTTETVPASAISRVNGNPALTLQITPSQGANVVEISHAVNAELDRLAPGLKAEFVTLFDQAPFIEKSIEDLSVEGGLGLFFAVLVILAFLASWRSTIIAAVSIPLSLLITLIGLQLSGNTLNILTLAALTIAIGRVVDDSIVVIENISRRRGSGPLTPGGVVASVRQVAGAITASTLTTVAVFLPIAFVSGSAGQLFRPFAVTVSIALLASLLVALTIVPVLAFWFMRNSRAKIPAAQPAEAEATAGAEATTELSSVDPEAAAEPSDLEEIHTPRDRLQRAFMPALNATRRHPVITLVSSGLILISTLVMSSMIPTDFLGSSGNESLQLMQTPADAEEDLVAAAEPVEQALAKVSGIRDVITSIPLSVAGTPSVISYDLQLEEGSDAEVVRAAVEEATGKLKDAGELNLLTQDAFVGGAGGDGIALQFRGKDPAALRAASKLLEEQLSKADGVQAVKSELAGEQPVVRIKLDEMKAATIGFDRTLVARTVQEALQGQQLGQMMFEGQERNIVLRTPGAERTADKLGEILLPITPQQTAAAQKIAADALKAKAEASAEEARRKGDAELVKQINEAASQRSELVSQISALSGQLALLQSAPIIPEEPLSPEDDALARAQQERAEQLAALEGAIAGAQGGLTGLDEQVTMLRKAQSDAATQLAEQEQATAEQDAVTETTGTAVRLGDIAVIEEELTAPTITRADGERQVTLTVTPKKGQLDAANLAVAEAISTAELPAGATFDVGGVSAEQDEAFTQLFAAMLAAIMLVLLIMVATFRNFRGPLVLLISIPFAATGAILALLLTGTALGLPALIGMLMLIGIVVTNAIVLMDLVNRLRESGASLDEAVEHGTRLRLRPILMTAAATIFALAPMSLGLTGGGIFISKPLAIVVIGGLISSTLLTLVLVPILYTLVERRREKKLAKRGARQERREARRIERDEAREAQRALKLGE